MFNNTAKSKSFFGLIKPERFSDRVEVFFDVLLYVTTFNVFALKFAVSFVLERNEELLRVVVFTLKPVFKSIELVLKVGDLLGD